MEPGPSGQEDDRTRIIVSASWTSAAMEPGPSGQEDTSSALMPYSVSPAAMEPGPSGQEDGGSRAGHSPPPDSRNGAWPFRPGRPTRPGSVLL